MANMTLREVCDVYGVTRRTIQGYEKAGLMKASGKNERGYLLYDEDVQERIRKIKFYQDIGFRLKDVNDVIDAPGNEIRAALEKKLIELEQRKMEIDHLIKQVYELMRTL